MTQHQHYDVAIIGAGPAGLQTALVLARTRKRVIVFDAPEPPRNSASHGVHNFIGLDGLLPAEIREQAWAQIAVYDSAQLCRERIIELRSSDSHSFSLHGSAGTSITARQVVLALGYQDVYPDVPGFQDCWGHTIIPCPFCDGYENRDRVWGLVASSEPALEHMPTLFKNWTRQAKLLVPAHLNVSVEQRDTFARQGISVHDGEIVEVHQTAGSVEGVTLTSGERVAVETLWWRPEEAPLALTQQIIETFSLELDSAGFIKTDAFHRTQVKGLWAVGDVRGWAGALGAAFAANTAAVAIVRGWHEEMLFHR